MLNRIIPSIGAICLLTAIPASAQTTAEHNKRTEIAKGADVVIAGCVAAGEKSGTYLLGKVEEVQAVPVATIRKRVYWLNNTKHIKDHVGYRVRIEGRVTDLERSEIEVDRGTGAKGGAIAKIEGPGGQAVETPVAKVGMGPVGTKGQLEADVPITLVKIKVRKVTRLAGSCS